MAPAPVKYGKCYLGIDPGANGGMASIITQAARTVDGRGVNGIYAAKELRTLSFSNRSEQDVWLTIAHLYPLSPRVVIERQVPRPTFYQNPRTGKVTNSILKSTCELFGHYQFLRGLLTAGDITFREVLPQEWQKHFGVARSKGMSDNQWKNVLKALALERYPEEHITLATADAVLLAQYAKETDDEA